MRFRFFCMLTVLLVCPLALAEDFLIDPKQVPDLNKQLEEIRALDQLNLLGLQSHRSSQCPLHSDDYADIVAKLNEIASGLGSGKCENHNFKVLEKFSAMLTEINNARIADQNLLRSLFHDTSTTNSTPPVLSDTDKALAAHAQETLKELSDASKDESCVNDLKDKGLLSAIANLAVGVGKIAMTSPSQNGLIIGTTGIAFASVIDLIKTLLRSPFNWEFEKDRSQFIALNCSFFKIRRDLADSFFFQARIDSSEQRIKDTEELLKRLESKQQELTKHKKDFGSHVAEKKKLYLKKTIDDKLLNFTDNTRTLLGDFEEAAKKTPANEAKIYYIMILLKYRPKVLDNNVLDEIQTPYTLHLKKLLSDFDPMHLENLGHMEPALFQKTYTELIKIYLQNILSTLSANEDKATREFISLKNAENASNENLIKKSEEAYLKIEQEFKTILEITKKQIAALKNKHRHDLDNPNKDGSHATYSIFDEIDTIKSILNGKRGESFLKYLIDDVREKFFKFGNGYRRWLGLYNHHNPTPIAWACRDASNLNLIWDQANAALEVMSDFLETNKGILSSDVHVLKLAMHFLPIGHSPEFKVFCYVRSLEIAKLIINGQDKAKIDPICREHSFNSPGLLMLKMKGSTGARRETEAFLDRHNCSQYF